MTGMLDAPGVSDRFATEQDLSHQQEQENISRARAVGDVVYFALFDAMHSSLAAAEEV